MAREMAESLMERWDGKGPPRKLQGGAIGLSARIVAAARLFDRLSSGDVATAGVERSQARWEVLRQSGFRLGPAVAAALGSLGETAG